MTSPVKRATPAALDIDAVCVAPLSSTSSPSSSASSSSGLDAAFTRELSNYCQQRGILSVGSPLAAAVNGNDNHNDSDNDNDNDSDGEHGESSGSELSAATDEGNENVGKVPFPAPGPKSRAKRTTAAGGGAGWGPARRVLGPSAASGRAVIPAGPAGARMGTGSGAVVEATVGTGVTLVKPRSQPRKHRPVGRSPHRTSSFSSAVSDGSTGLPESQASQRSPSVSRSSLYDSDDVLSLDDASAAASEVDGAVLCSPGHAPSSLSWRAAGSGALGSVAEQPEPVDDVAPASGSQQVTLCETVQSSYPITYPIHPPTHPPR